VPQGCRHFLWLDKIDGHHCRAEQASEHLWVSISSGNEADQVSGANKAAIHGSKRRRISMSTKSTINYSDGEFHVYRDVIDEMLVPQEQEPPIYLRLDACEFEAYSSGSVVLTIQASTARKLGLLPTKSEAVSRD
jgi:hypothetical protein